MSRPTFMTINLHALLHNQARVQALAPGCSIMAMVKANAYGHGLQRIAKALTAVAAFGVASIDEGVALRQAGILQPINLIEGLFHQDEIHEAAEHGFSLIVHHEPHLEMLARRTTTRPFPVWLKSIRECID